MILPQKALIVLVTATATIGVAAAAVDRPDIASTDFERGNSAPFEGANGSTKGNQHITIMDDPTGLLDGKVARIEFRRTLPRQAPDVNRALRYRVNRGIGLGETVFFRGDIVIPRPDPNMASAMRKLFYIQRQPNDNSFAVIKADGQSLRAEITRHRVFNAGPNSFPFDKRVSLEVQITTNSGPGVPDGTFRVWKDGVVVIEANDVVWLTTAKPFKVFMFGQQTQHKKADRQVMFDEVRYWDNIAISTKRIGGL